MSNTELKVIREAMRSTRDLIQILNDSRDMPEELWEMFYQLNRYSCTLSEMLEEANYD